MGIAIAFVVIVIVVALIAWLVSRRRSDPVASFRRQIDALSPEARRPTISQATSADGESADAPADPAADDASDDQATGEVSGDETPKGVAWDDLLAPGGESGDDDADADADADAEGGLDGA